MKHAPWTWIKWACLGLAAGSVAAAAWMMWRAQDNHLDIPAKAGQARKPGAHVDKPLIVEREAGRTLWRLRAARAEQQLSGAMHLIEPELELFTDKGERVPVTGREAWFEPLTRRVRFRGHVRVHYRDWLLKSEELRYEHAKDVLVIPGAFRLQGAHTRARGRGLTLWRGNQRLRVAHGVWVEDDRTPKGAAAALGDLP